MNVHIYRDWKNGIATVEMDGFAPIHFDEQDMFVLGWIYSQLQKLEAAGHATMIKREHDTSFESPKLYERWGVY